ncbi:MAG: hypothetical protein KUG75_01210 [Pseudomonadales bacterium]|nr:hypothetical protein [Pseudomonadales bacterium]
MDESELLLTIAQISVAFAGFASLATIFVHHTGQDDAYVDSGRLLNMLTVSLIVTGLALIPFVPILLRVADRWVWGVSGVIGIVTIAATLPAILRRTAVMKQHTGFKRFRANVNYALLTAACGALLCCVFGLPSDHLFPAYCFALFTLLISTGNLFFGVIESLARGR